MEDMISLYGYVDQASVLLLQPSLKRNQLDREVIVVFQAGQEGSTTSSRIPLAQHLKNPSKDIHLYNAVLASTEFANCVFPVLGLHVFGLAVHTHVFLFRLLPFRSFLHCLGHPVATFASNVLTILA